MKVSSVIQQQKGMALLSVLLTLTICSLLAFSLSRSLQTQVRKVETFKNREQAWWYHISAEQQAKTALIQSFDDNSEVIYLGQPWSVPQTSITMDRGTLSSKVVDLQTCFNLNSLARYSAEKNKIQPIDLMYALLENYDISHTGLADAVRDWIHPDTVPLTAAGADDADYLSLPVPYLAGNTQMRDESELRAVFNVNRTEYATLSEVVCTIPTTDLSLNVNTLESGDSPLLAAFFLNRITVSHAQEIISQRPQKGWPSVAGFLAQDLLSNIKKDDLTPFFNVSSDYFEVESKVTAGLIHSRMRSLLARADEKELDIIRRRMGDSL